MTVARKKLQDVFRSRTLHSCPSVSDPISARMVEQVGFELGLIAGSVTSISILGAPDHTLVSLTEFAQSVGRTCDAVEIPLIADADHGFGNALNVARTVHELERAGIAGLTIEDTLLPKPFGGAQAPLISIAECVGKLNAALSARKDTELAIIARTNVSECADEEECIRRLQAYQACGVDAICLVRVRDSAQLQRLTPYIQIPYMLLGKLANVVDPAPLLMQAGASIWYEGHNPYLAALSAMFAAYKSQRQGEPYPSHLSIMSSEELAQLTRADYFKSMIERHLRA